jgi:hypothetical protein
MMGCQSAAKLCRLQVSQKNNTAPYNWQQFAGPGGEDGAMPYTAYRRILADNLRRLMDENPSLSTPEKIAKRCHWVGGKRKGKPIAERTIRYLLEAKPDSPAPALDLVVSVAECLGVEPWELLVHAPATRRHILERMLGTELEQADSPPTSPAKRERRGTKPSQKG